MKNKMAMMKQLSFDIQKKASDCWKLQLKKGYFDI